MKNNLIITLALGLFLVSCKNSNKQDASSGKDVSNLSQPDVDCISYSIFNPHGPSGATVLYTYIDCNGGQQSGSVEPQQTVNVFAQRGTVKCPGGVVTESGVKKGIKPLAQLTQSDIDCTSYSIFNPHGPSGATVLYTYIDCNGREQSGSVDPQEIAYVLAQPGTVKCPGGVVTESEKSNKTGSGVNPMNNPAQSKP